MAGPPVSSALGAPTPCRAHEAPARGAGGHSRPAWAGSRCALLTIVATVTLVAAACMPINGAGSSQPTTKTVDSDPQTTGSWSAPNSSGSTIMMHAVVLPGTTKVLLFDSGTGA